MARMIDADELMLTLIGLREEAMRRADFSDAATISQIKILVKNAPTIGWISVKERLPQDDQWVAALLYGLVGYNTILLQYNAMLNEFITDDGIEYDIDDVAYWVGLPEPPEVEGEEK